MHSPDLHPRPSTMAARSLLPRHNTQPSRIPPAHHPSFKAPAALVDPCHERLLSMAMVIFLPCTLSHLPTNSVPSPILHLAQSSPTCQTPMANSPSSTACLTACQCTTRVGTQRWESTDMLSHNPTLTPTGPSVVINALKASTATTI